MDLERLIDAVLEREGGYCDHPADRGGETCFGITAGVARANGYDGAMRALPERVARDIYRRLYWLRPRFDAVAAIAPDVAGDLFDTAVNMGAPVAIGFLQRALNALNRGASDYPDIVADKRIGAATLGALRSFRARRGPGGEAVLRKAIAALQGERYLALAERRPADEAFLYGWLANRIG